MRKWTSGRFEVPWDCFEFCITFTWHAVKPRLKEAYQLRLNTLCPNRWCYLSLVVLLCRCLWTTRELLCFMDISIPCVVRRKCFEFLSKKLILIKEFLLETSCGRHCPMQYMCSQR